MACSGRCGQHLSMRPRCREATGPQVVKPAKTRWMVVLFHSREYINHGHIPDCLFRFEWVFHKFIDDENGSSHGQLEAWDFGQVLSPSFYSYGYVTMRFKGKGDTNGDLVNPMKTSAF